jgi:hypothetical protein
MKDCLLILRSFAEEYGLPFKPLPGHPFVALEYLDKYVPVEESRTQTKKGLRTTSP